jgi:hypothetical protein
LLEIFQTLLTLPRYKAQVSSYPSFILETNREDPGACFRRHGVSRVTREQYFVLSAANSFALFIFFPLFPVPSPVRGIRREKKDEQTEHGMRKFFEASNDLGINLTTVVMGTYLNETNLLVNVHIFRFSSVVFVFVLL